MSDAGGALVVISPARASSTSSVLFRAAIIAWRDLGVSLGYGYRGGGTMVRVIERVYIHNYKCLVNFELKLQETVLLLGANGVGKTAVLDVMFGLRKLLAGEAKITDRVAFHPSTLTRWQARREQVFVIQATIGGESFIYRLEIEHMDDGRRSRIVEESLVADATTLFRCDLGDVQLFRDDGSEGPTYKADWSESALARVVPQASNTRLTAFMGAMQDMVVCTIRPTLLGAESTREDRQLNRDADNFADWYRQAVLEDPSSTRSHVEALTTGDRRLQQPPSSAVWPRQSSTHVRLPCQRGLRWTQQEPI